VILTFLGLVTTFRGLMQKEGVEPRRRGLSKRIRNGRKPWKARHVKKLWPASPVSATIVHSSFGSGISSSYRFFSTIPKAMYRFGRRALYSSAVVWFRILFRRQSMNEIIYVWGFTFIPKKSTQISLRSYVRIEMERFRPENVRTRTKPVPPIGPLHC